MIKLSCILYVSEIALFISEYKIEITFVKFPVIEYDISLEPIQVFFKVSVSFANRFANLIEILKKFYIKFKQKRRHKKCRI